MKISIIVPVYNVEPYIYDCLNSVGRQDYDGEIECLVVDDCGSDNSMDIVEEYIRNYQGKVHFKVLRRDANGGLSAARNTGLAAASGEYVMFLDSDDELTLNAVSLLTAPLAGKNYDLVIAPYKAVGSSRPMPMLALETEKAVRGSEILESFMRHEWYMMAPNKLYRHSFLEKSGLSFLEGVIHEDELWSLQVAMKAESMFVIGDCAYIYKVREGSITTATVNHRKRAESFVAMFCEAYNDACRFNRQRERNLHRYMQRFFRNGMAEVGICKDRKLFRTLYRKVRHTAPVKFFDAIAANKLDPAEFVMNLHWLMSEKIAEKILWQYFKRFNVK